MTTSLKLDAKLKKRMQRLADLKDRSAHSIMIRAIIIL